MKKAQTQIYKARSPESEFMELAETPKIIKWLREVLIELNI